MQAPGQAREVSLAPTFRNRRFGIRLRRMATSAVPLQSCPRHARGNFAISIFRNDLPFAHAYRCPEA